MILDNVSYRYKVPLMLSAAILLTGLVVSIALVWRAFGDLKEDLYRNALEVGSVLSNTLPAAIKHDDLWLAYQLIGAARVSGESEAERMLIVLDDDYRVYVSNEPTRFPVMSRLRAQDARLARLEAELRQRHSLEPYPLEPPGSDHIFTVLPMIDDGVALGTLIIGYPRSLFLPRFHDIVRRVAYSTLAVLALLLPIAWYLGNRAVKPLTQLAHCMGRVGRAPPDKVDCQLEEGRDEIGQLGTSFRQMLLELQEKQRLEREMIASERMAAVGRLAAGVAHEINNPLGGMLNAIGTYRHHGSPDPLAEKTLSLIERGLKQIGNTVSALLVEARSESHRLTPRDIEDIHTLLQPDLQKHSVRLAWESRVDSPLPLPSTPVRQILINLALNAIQAAERGWVMCRIEVGNGEFRITVENGGRAIGQEEMGRLFEPFTRCSQDGSGLGLWVTYRIVEQLDGRIDVRSRDGKTRFRVVLPLTGTEARTGGLLPRMNANRRE